VGDVVCQAEWNLKGLTEVADATLGIATSLWTDIIPLKWTLNNPVLRSMTDIKHIPKMIIRIAINVEALMTVRQTPHFKAIWWLNAAVCLFVSHKKTPLIIIICVETMKHFLGIP
jgi:hypothetical protein